MMAAERGGSPASSRPTAAADHSVLVAVGALRSPGALEHFLRQIETGEQTSEGRRTEPQDGKSTGPSQ